MVDEAHRTQYGALAARMRAGLPNACMIAFTGTPIDKKDRSTREVFGDYLHRYLIDQAVKDGATVPIYYEMRDAQLGSTDAISNGIFGHPSPNCRTKN